MYPVIGTYDTIFIVWGYAAVLGTVMNFILARRDGHAPGRAALAFALIGATFLLGTKAHFWLANPDLVREMGLGQLLWYGFHLPGGILLSLVLAPLALRAVGLRPLAFLDSIAPGIAFAIGVARLGCFANGCCFGYVSHQPWALAFPIGSRAYEHHLRLGLIASDERFSLPVLPLMLMFSAVGFAIGVTLCWWRARRRFEGQLALALVALWSSTNVVIELWRDPAMVPGTPHLWAVSLVIASLSLPALIALTYRHRDQHLPLPPSPIGADPAYGSAKPLPA